MRPSKLKSLRFSFSVLQPFRPSVFFYAGSLVVLAALAAYHNSFSGPFIFDDGLAITNNPTIRQLGRALAPPAGTSVGSRPIFNLTFAINYALGGMDTWGYHAFNLLVHALAGLTLFGIVRRTLCEHLTSNFQHPTSKSNGSISPQSVFGNDAALLALAVAVIWVVHPLQTEAGGRPPSLKLRKTGSQEARSQNPEASQWTKSKSSQAAIRWLLSAGF